MSHKTNVALILFKRTISLVLIFELVFPPSLLIAMDSEGDDRESVTRQAFSVSPAAAALVTTTAQDGREVTAIKTMSSSTQNFEKFQFNNSGVELSSVPLVVNPRALPPSRNIRNNLGFSDVSDISLPLTTLAVVCRPPSPSIPLARGVQEVDDTQFALNPLTSSGSSQRENETNLHSKKTSRFKSESLDITTLGVAGSPTTAQQNTSNPFVSPAVTTFLNAMGWTVQDLQDHNISLTALHKILPIETRIMPNFLRWASIDRWGARLFHLPLLDFGGLGHSDEGLKQQGKKSWSRFWMQGRSLPLKSGYTLRKAVASDAFREGLEFGVAKGLNLTLAAILMYQITQPSDNIIAVYQSSSTNSVLALSNYFKNHPALFSVFAFPPVYGLLKAVSSLREIDASLTLKDIKEAEKIFDHLSPTFWNTYLRGLLPFHPLRSSLQKFEQRLVWEGRQDKCGQQEREAAYQLIEKVARQGKGFTQTEGFYGLARLAYGLNLNDLPKLRGAQDNSSLLHRLSLKTRAFESLSTLRPDSGLTKLYQDYYLWSLGHSPSFWKTSIPMATMKTVRLATQVFSLWAICKAISDYFNCPDKPGLSFTGYQPWSSSYSQSCFDELVSQFNIIPGQSANTLIDVIPQYHFSDGTYNLDLSGKGIQAETLGEIIQGFKRQYQQGKAPLLTALNLGGNNLGNPEALTQVLSIIPHTVRTLGLSSINTYQTTAWELAMAQSLSLIPFVTKLDLSNNFIGLTGNTGTVALGQSLGNLTALTFLNLGNNLISYNGDAGTVALGQSLGNLRALQYLDLSHNFIGWLGDAGTVALGQSLGNLRALQYLDLSHNFIGWLGDAGTVALGQSLGNLTALQYLNLGDNNIGIGGNSGAVALGRGLSYLKRLTSFIFFHNPIIVGVAAVAQGLRNNTNLKFLDLSYTGIGLIEQDVAILADTLASLPSLQTFYLLPCYLTPTAAQTLNHRLALNPNIGPIPMPLSDPEAVHIFFQTIPLNTTTLNLSKRVGGAGDNVNTINTLMQYLAKFPNLTSLDLSYNGMGWFNSLGVIALGQGLKNLTSLTSLDLSNNLIGKPGTLGEQAIAQGVMSLIALQSFNLYNNLIGYTGDAGTVALGQSLGNLTSLQSFNLGVNFIGRSGDAGTVALGHGLRCLPLLTNFDLSVNHVGFTADQGTQIIGHNLGKLTNLNSLNLASNPIGTTGKNGSFSILTALPQLSHLETINLAGMQNVSWTQGAQALASFTNQKLLDACESQLCHGTAVTPANKASTSAVTSSATRLQVPLPFRLMNNALDGLGRLLFNSWNTLVDKMRKSAREVTSDSPAYFPNINNPHMSDWQPNPFRNREQSEDYASLAPYVLQQSTRAYVSLPALLD